MSLGKFFLLSVSAWKDTLPIGELGKAGPFWEDNKGKDEVMCKQISYWLLRICLFVFLATLVLNLIVQIPCTILFLLIVASFKAFFQLLWKEVGQILCKIALNMIFQNIFRKCFMFLIYNSFHS